ncbi:MAG: CynX/NimT family MFS transporter, partial [Thermomicrobiales bacterium]
PAAWRTPLALWGVLAAAALVGWVGVLRPWRQTESAPVARNVLSATNTAAAWSPWRDRRAWLSALLFAAQGLVYYLLVAWLPAIYREAGLDATATAALFVVFNAATLPAIILFPSWSDRLHRRRPPIFVAALCCFVGTLGLLLLPTADPWRWLWPALAGAAVSGLFAMSLVLPADIAPRGQTGAAAGMVLGIGYAAAALGPIVAGVVRDITGSFAVTLLLLPAFGLAMIALSAIVPELSSAQSVE